MKHVSNKTYQYHYYSGILFLLYLALLLRFRYTAESDFIAVNSDVITFLANETLLSATVSIVDDTTVEDDETFYLTLATDTANGVRIENEETTITIRDMDSKYSTSVTMVL